MDVSLVRFPRCPASTARTVPSLTTFRYHKLQDFLFENTGPFLHELWCFRWSKAGMAAYDRDAVYSPRRQGS